MEVVGAHQFPLTVGPFPLLLQNICLFESYFSRQCRLPYILANAYLQLILAWTMFWMPLMYWWTWASTSLPQVGSMLTVWSQAANRAEIITEISSNAFWADEPLMRHTATVLNGQFSVCWSISLNPVLACDATNLFLLIWQNIIHAQNKCQLLISFTG